MGEIFCRLNFHGVRFLWLKPPTKICCHENFATLTWWKDGCWVQKKAMRAWIPRLQQHMGSCCWRNAGLCKRAEECSWPWYAKLATMCLLFAVVAFCWRNCIYLRSNWAQCLFSCTGPLNSDGIPRLHFISIPQATAMTIFSISALGWWQCSNYSKFSWV